MAKTDIERLTRREREIMNAVFALGNRGSAENIRERLTDPPSDSSVRVMLARLEQKGFLRHRQDGLRYIYSATTPPAVAKRTALQQYLQTFCGGSLRQMMVSLVGDASWTAKRGSLYDGSESIDHRSTLSTSGRRSTRSPLDHIRQ